MLRAFAFLLVFAAHGLAANLEGPTQWGAVGRSGEFGVCVFFFLSSYLITELLLREKLATGTVQIKAFYVRRILRIWPLYFAFIAVGWAYGMASHRHPLSLAWVLALLLMYTNWYTAGHDYPPGFLFPLWSISLEEQFYLAWPLLMKFLSANSLMMIAGLLMVSAYGALAVLLHRGASLDPAIWVNSLVQFQFFALGTMTALLLHGRVPKLGKPLRWFLFFSGLLCLRGAQAAVYASDQLLPHDFLHLAPRFFLALVACLCLFFSFLPMTGGKLQKPFIYLGKISYGLYVFHVLWLGFARDGLEHFVGDRVSPLALEFGAMAIALPLTVVTGMLSYRFLESPFLRMKKHFTVVRSRPV